MYSFVVNMDDKEKSYVSTWHYAYCNGAPFVYIREGGREIIELFQGSTFYASCEYLISPDGSWENISGGPEVGHEFFSSKGIIEHTCDPVENSIIQKDKANPFLLSVTKNSLLLNVTKGDVYSIKLFSVSGQHISAISNKKMNEEINKIEMNIGGLSKGVYFAEVKCSNDIVRQKVVIK